MKKSFLEDEYNIQPDLSHMYSVQLKESDIEFLKMKRMKFHNDIYAPDPRLGDYET
jgi:hypothetical protein